MLLSWNYNYSWENSQGRHLQPMPMTWKRYIIQDQNVSFKIIPLAEAKGSHFHIFHASVSFNNITINNFFSRQLTVRKDKRTEFSLHGNSARNIWMMWKSVYILSTYYWSVLRDVRPWAVWYIETRLLNVTMSDFGIYSICILYNKK